MKPVQHSDINALLLKLSTPRDHAVALMYIYTISLSSQQAMSVITLKYSKTVHNSEIHIAHAQLLAILIYNNHQVF